MERDTRRVIARWASLAVVATAALAGVAIITEVEAGWQRPHADAQASNRVLEPGQLAGDPDHHPGFSEIVEIERPELTATMLRDVNDDGVPELLLPFRGRVGAIDMTQGAFIWQSGVAGVDRLGGFADFDGDGALELLAASSRVGGGLVTVDPSTGAILARTAPLPNRSGVDARELSIADLDEDGDDDVVYPAGFYGLGQLWIDGLGPAAEQWSASLSFGGYANITPMRVGRFGSDGKPALMLDQGGPNQQVFERCDPKTPGAACGASACWCRTDVFAGVQVGAYAFGPAFVIDVDDDGLDEILTVADDPRYTRSLSLFSPQQARTAGSGAGGQLWYRDYSAGVTVPITPEIPPIDLDGDGGLEQLVSFVDNVDADRNLAGQPISDGIDHEGLSVGVFDARTGQVEASLEDAFAHGWIDLDGDGRPEIVVSSVLGYEYQAGLRGYEFGCANGCLEEAWSVPHGFAPTIVRESFDQQHVPTPTVPILRGENKGDTDALLAYHDDALHVLRFVDGQLVSTAVRPLGEEQSVLGVDGAFAVLSDDRKLQMVDATLTNVGPTIPIPVQGTAPWTTARLDDFDAPIYESKLYDAPLSTGNFAEPEQLLPHVALSENLDGLGTDEIIDFRRPEDELGSGFEVRALGWSDGQLVKRWSVVSEEEPALDGLEVSSAMHFGTGNFDGVGALDIVFATQDAARDTYLVAVDGDAGEILGVQAATTPSASFTPLVVGDWVSMDGTPEPDGLDDVIIDGQNYFELIAFGHPQPLWTQETGFYHAVGGQADIDGDGVRELIATTSNKLENPAQALEIGAANISSVWGPLQLGLPTGRTQVMSFAHVDGDAGLDMLYITGEGALEIRNGQTGAMLTGTPVYLSDGHHTAASDPEAASLGALMVIDVDSDGHDEAIVGADDGWVYALAIAGDNMSPADIGTIEWALEVGAPVSQFAAGDVDADGFQEVLVATEAGQGIVLDSLGVALEITGPGEGCFPAGPVEISGTAYGLAFVDVYINGELADTVAVENSKWSAQVMLPGSGEYEIRAEGRDEHGEIVALSTSTLCGDGTGEACDPEVEPCDDDGRIPDEDWRLRGRCHCSSEPERTGFGGMVPLGVVVVLAWRRRKIR